MHGWLNLNKPEGITSAKAVSIVKKALGVKKLGHTGTLDPLACGVLPLAVGEATKLSQYIVADEKEYRFTVEWGRATSTDDREGEVIATSEKRPTIAEIEALLPEFTGTIMQRPPNFSAIKIKGERAYKKAREGKPVDIPAREVRVKRLKIENFSPSPKGRLGGGAATAHEIAESPPSLTLPPAGGGGKVQTITFHVTCGKGTYIRSLARDMGARLGCYGTVTFLQRCRAGEFSLSTSVSLDFREESGYMLPSDFGLIALDAPLDDILAVSFGPDQMQRLLQGQSASPLNAGVDFWHARVLRCYDATHPQLKALGKPTGSKVRPMRVFNIT